MIIHSIVKYYILQIQIYNIYTSVVYKRYINNYNVGYHTLEHDGAHTNKLPYIIIYCSPAIMNSISLKIKWGVQNLQSGHGHAEVKVKTPEN